MLGASFRNQEELCQLEIEDFFAVYSPKTNPSSDIWSLLEKDCVAPGSAKLSEAGFPKESSLIHPKGGYAFEVRGGMV